MKLTQTREESVTLVKTHPCTKVFTIVEVQIIIFVAGTTWYGINPMREVLHQIRDNLKNSSLYCPDFNTALTFVNYLFYFTRDFNLALFMKTNV
jgi:hypothetical protein